MNSKGKKTTMLTRGASFRRQGSSGMTWADNWIFTDDGMFLGRHSKVADDKGAAAGSAIQRPGQQIKGKGGDDPIFPAQLQRSQSHGSGADGKSRAHRGVWGFRWIKKSLKKAFR